MGGFAAETAAAATLFGTATLGIPVSTTHTITGSLVGVGCADRFSAVRWSVMRRVLYVWVLPSPAPRPSRQQVFSCFVRPVALLIPSVLAAGLVVAVRWLSRRPAVTAPGQDGELSEVTVPATRVARVRSRNRAGSKPRQHLRT